MAPSVTKPARKKLAWMLALLLTCAGLIGLGVATNQPGASFVPELALDLQGGTSIILSPTVAEGTTVSTEQLNQAVGIIRQRVDSTGVSESTITTSGNANIVVEIPGTPSESTLQLIKSSAKLEFRAVLLASAGTAAQVGGDSSATASPSASATPSQPATQPSVAPTNGSDLNWITPELRKKFDAFDCSTQFRAPGQVDDMKAPLITCDTGRFQKYILGPVELDGTNIADATAGTITTQTGASTNEWAVNLAFDGEGTSIFSAVTSRLFPLETPRNQFAVTLDGYVITDPAAKAVITNGEAQITGGFTKESSQSLADQLKYGSLPIGFEVQSQENISATLGSESLRSGLLAGLIGLLLVVIYSMFQYRALAIVTVGSLIVAAVLTYLLIALLSWRQGYRLSLSGVAGLIVAIGITADSFIVYFERVRDELRDGRALSTAVDAAWSRAVRTILVSDAVSLLAAVVLFSLTVGSVKGFAFTLGLTTLVDLAVVVLFTHPILQVLAQRKFFSSGHKWSGFDSKAMGGAMYLGRGKFSVSDRVSDAKRGKASKEAEKRQTIAERKLAQANENGAKN
ncbi:MAG: protein translocase subunit SecD [Actinomycetota bacterium]